MYNVNVVQAALHLFFICSTGWWLSMKPEDQFLKKMQPLSSRNQLLLDDNERFGGYNAKTIGFLLVGD